MAEVKKVGKVSFLAPNFKRKARIFFFNNRGYVLSSALHVPWSVIAVPWSQPTDTVHMS
jgi:hypothetical protein